MMKKENAFWDYYSQKPELIVELLKFFVDVDIDFFGNINFAIIMQLLPSYEVDKLIIDICSSLKKADYLIQYRMASIFYKFDASFGTSVADVLGLEIDAINFLSALPNKQRVVETYSGSDYTCD